MKHLISAADLDRPTIYSLLSRAAQLHDVQRSQVKKIDTLRGKTVINLFFEDSTRTRTSFEIAGKWMSADTINISAKGSSASKGESLRDTIRTINAMAVDAIVMRHPASGAPRLAAQWTDAHILNAGDGMCEHPTQALLDAYTMTTRLGDLAGKHVAIVGDLTHSRVFRSNLHVLKALGASITAVAPPTLLPSGIDSWSKEHGFAVSYNFDEVLAQKPDVIMMLRVQKERMSGGYFPTAREYTVGYGLTANRWEGVTSRKPDTLVLHPGPMNRGLEISAGPADDVERSGVLDQVSAGVAIRMAVLERLIVGEKGN